MFQLNYNSVKTWPTLDHMINVLVDLDGILFHPEQNWPLTPVGGNMLNYNISTSISTFINFVRVYVTGSGKKAHNCKKRLSDMLSLTCYM